MSRLTFLQHVALAIAGDPIPDAPEAAWADLERRGEAQAYLARARAVLRALPPPTEGMISAFYEAHATAATVFADPRRWWRAMLDRAIEQDQVPAYSRASDPEWRAPTIGGVLR